MLLILLLAAALVLLYANRALIFEQRSAANQWRSTQAFEAAEAGRNWVIAQLNGAAPIDSACQPTAPADPQAADQRFRQRYLAVDPETGQISPAVDATPGCAADADGRWQCRCPSSGSASLSTGSDAETPSFGLRMASGPKPGTLRVTVTGCSHIGLGCGGSAAADASAQIQFLLASLSVLARPPAATLSAGAAITLQSGVSVVNADPAGGGTTLLAGGTPQWAADVRLIGPPGSPGGSDTTLGGDAQFLDAGGAPLSDERQFALVFTLSRSRWRELPGVQTLNCQGGCSSAEVDRALASGARLLWIAGSLQVNASPNWGRASAPLLLIVDGHAEINGALQFAGLLHARSLSWNNPGGAVGTLRGALVTTGNLQASGQLQLLRDADVLARLARTEAVYLPVPGSWRDFTD